MPGDSAPNRDRSTHLSRLKRERRVTDRQDGSLLAIDRVGSGQLETLLLLGGEWLVGRRHVAGERAGRGVHFEDDSVAIRRGFAG